MDSFVIGTWKLGIYQGYNYNYFEGMNNDDIGIQGYADSLGDFVFVASSVISPALIEECHKKKKIVGVFTSQSDSESKAFFDRLEKLGVDIVLTSNPENTPSFIRSHN